MFLSLDIGQHPNIVSIRQQILRLNSKEINGEKSLLH